MAQLEQGGHNLQTASLVIHELSYGIQRLAQGRRKRRLSTYLQSLMASGLPVLAYDREAALLCRRPDCRHRCDAGSGAGDTQHQRLRAV